MIKVSKGMQKINMPSKKEKSQNNELPELLTLQEASAMLKVHPNTLRQWDKKGILPAIRIGTKRVRRYRKQDIMKLLNQNMNNT